jgi:Ca2+-binding RTX toxin-like protein
VGATVRFAPGTGWPTFAEDAGFFELTLVLSEPSSREVVVTIAINGETDGADLDMSTRTVTFAPGETSATLLVPIYDDAADEIDENVIFEITGAANASVDLSVHEAYRIIGEILDNDVPAGPVVRFAPGTGWPTFSEGAGFFELTLVLSEASSQEVTATIMINGETDGDDIDMAAKTVTFAPGETSATLRVPIYEDTRDEIDENVIFEITGATNASVDLSVHDAYRIIGEILDNDVPATNIAGTEGDDVLMGTDGADVIQGLGGADIIYPGAGEDQIFGGAGDDSFRLSTLSSGYPLSRFDGGEGVDTFDYSVATSFLYFHTVAGEPNVFYVLDNRVSGVERIIGGSAGDIFSFIYFTDPVTVFGGAGDDYFSGGGAGADTFFGEGGADNMFVGPGDHADGGDGDDQFFLSGAFGTPPIAGAVNGGGGEDLLKLNIAFSVDLAAGTATAGSASYLITSIETVMAAAILGYQTIVLGSDGAEAFLVNPLFDDGSIGVVFDGRGGDDRLSGSAGADNLAGGTGDDGLQGLAGNDLLRLNDGGDDSASGGAGNDVLYFGAAFSGADVADGGEGRDVVVLQGNYALTLSASNLTGVESISLQSGSRTTWGDVANNFYDYNITTNNANVAAGQQLIVNGQTLRAGEDFTFDGSAETDGYFLVYGGHGVDTLKGGAGNDAFFFEGARWGAGDTVDGGLGRDALIISSGSGVNHFDFGANALTGIESISLNNRYTTDPSQKPSYELVLSNGNVAPGATLIVNGSSLADRTQTVGVDGSAVHDGNLILFGGFGNDILIGGDGADLFQGGEGVDMLTGGGGADVFRYAGQYDATSQLPDRILDFASGVDKIDLTRIDADLFTAGDQAFHWIGSGAFGAAGAASAGELRAYAFNGSWYVEGDMDGNGSADLVIQLTIPAAPPVQGDFLL